MPLLLIRYTVAVELIGSEFKFPIGRNLVAEHAACVTVVVKLLHPRDAQATDRGSVDFPKIDGYIHQSVGLLTLTALGSRGGRLR